MVIITFYLLEQNINVTLNYIVLFFIYNKMFSL